MTFKEWYDAQPDEDSPYLMARAAWNAALKEAKDELNRQVIRALESNTSVELTLDELIAPLLG